MSHDLTMEYLCFLLEQLGIATRAMVAEKTRALCVTCKERRKVAIVVCKLKDGKAGFIESCCKACMIDKIRRHQKERKRGRK